MGLLPQTYSQPQGTRGVGSASILIVLTTSHVGFQGYWPALPQQGLYNPAQQWPPAPYPAMGAMPPQLPLGGLAPPQRQQLQELLERMQKEIKKEDTPELGATDEETLVDAFRKGTESGLTPPQILERLSKVCMNATVGI